MAIAKDPDKMEEGDKVDAVPPAPRGILKNKDHRITFGNLPVLDSIEDDTPQEREAEEEVEIRFKKKNVRPFSRISETSVVSTYNPQCNSNYTALASLLVLRVLFIDVLTSLADVVSDFMQGEFLLRKASTRTYGWVVLGANWIPGLVAVVHLLAFYREGYLASEKSIRKKEIKRLLCMVLACFLLYPILPTIGYLFTLLNMNIKNKPQRLVLLDTVAQTAHSIAGCIEAPIQLILTVYMILLGLLEIPRFFSLEYAKDEYENVFYKFNIPMFSMIFSFINILTCAMKINIFNVYIVQLRTFEDLKRYTHLGAGYFPFFLHSVMFRILSFTVIFIYLNRWAAIPVGVMFVCNLLIGYVFLKELHYDQPIKDRYKSLARNKPVGSGLLRKIRSSPDEDAPVWLNTFLGLFVPSCYMMGALPEMLDKLSEQEKFRVYREQARFQKKIIRYQIVISNIIILCSLGVIFYKVNFTGFGYPLSTLTFVDFNICMGLLLFQTLISFLFIPEIDTLKRFGMNYYAHMAKTENDDSEEKTEKKGKGKRKFGTVMKIGVIVLISVLLLTPPIASYALSMVFSLPNVYIISKTNANESIHIEVTKTVLLNMNALSDHVVKETYMCENFTKQLVVKDKLLMLTNECIKNNPGLELISSTKDMEDYMKGIAGLILLTSDPTRSSAYPWKYSIFKDVKDFPVVLVNYYDTERILKRNGTVVEFTKEDLTSALSDSNSQLYTFDCSKVDFSNGVNLYKREGVFLGCNGNPKVKVKVKISCKDKNRDCPELSSFENSLLTDKPFEACNKIEGLVDPEEIYPAMTCTNLPSPWMNVHFLGNHHQQFRSMKCHKDNHRVSFPEGTCRAKDEDPSKVDNWGAWILESECIVDDIDGVKYRFARLSSTCVMMDKLWTGFDIGCKYKAISTSKPSCSDYMAEKQTP